MEKFHVHVYRVVEKMEVNVEAESEKDAKEKALGLAGGGDATVVESDCEFIAISFQGHFPVCT